MNIVFTPSAWKHYTEWQAKDRKLVDKINELIKEISRSGAVGGKGKPEHLRNLPFYSRRINKEHRLLYSIDSEWGLVISSCKGHYSD